MGRKSEKPPKNRNFDENLNFGSPYTKHL